MTTSEIPHSWGKRRASEKKNKKIRVRFSMYASIVDRRRSAPTECALLLQVPHLQAAPCLSSEQDPQGHPFPWFETVPLVDDAPVLPTLRENWGAGTNANRCSQGGKSLG